MKPVNYIELTELPGTKVSREQIQRLANRYHFAANYCKDKDVLELACGPGIGLGILKRCARSLVAGDIDSCILEKARETYACSIDCRCIDAQELPFEENSFDVVIMFEAIYYLEKPELFVQQARRVLRENGTIIVCNPNKDLPDFNPSPFSNRYFNAPEFREFFEPMGFKVSCYGDCPVDTASPKSKALSSLKKIAVKLHLMPKTMKGKVLFKRIVFGKLTEMPASLSDIKMEPEALTPIVEHATDSGHKVLFCVATLRRSDS